MDNGNGNIEGLKSAVTAADLAIPSLARRAWVTKTYFFEAAHHLPAHEGKCVRNHGHTYELQIAIYGEIAEGLGPKQGMVMEFYDLNQIVRDQAEAIIKQLDHHDLNEAVPAVFQPATTENVAWYIFHRLYCHPELCSKLKLVLLKEGPWAQVEITVDDYEEWLQAVTEVDGAHAELTLPAPNPC